MTTKAKQSETSYDVGTPGMALPPQIRFSSDPYHPPHWPANGLMFFQKVTLLERIAPQEFGTLHTVINAMLRDHWWRLSRTAEGTKVLLRAMKEADGGVR